MSKIDNEVTIVTAFTDLGREDWVGEVNGQMIPKYIKRDLDTYIERFLRLTKLKNDIVVFCDSDIRERLERECVTRGKENITWMSFKDNLPNDYDNLKQKIIAIQQNKNFIDFVERKSAPEYWNSEYVMINYLKSHFVNQCDWLDNEDVVAWIDFGYCREDEDAPQDKTFVFETNDKINLFQNGIIFDNLIYTRTPIFDLIKTGDVYIQGSHIISNYKMFKYLKDLMHNSLDNLLRVGLIDDDQTMLLMSYRSQPDIFNLIENDSSDWFNVIRNNVV